MHHSFVALILSYSLSWFICGTSCCQDRWTDETHQGYDLHYTLADSSIAIDVIPLIDSALTRIRMFFGDEPSQFGVVIYPDRRSLDSAWQKDWSMPGFRSECWMVASGVSDRLDILSPRVWKLEACEHDADDRDQTAQLIIHELVHVFHGQHNRSPDFSEVEGIDWFIKGLAVYASGQFDSSRLAAVRRSFADGEVPGNLDDFWKGKNRYGFSGSMVEYIDKRFGREQLLKLIPFTRKDELLGLLDISEEELIDGWMNDLMNRDS